MIEPHPVVTLLIKRMETNPEEFLSGNRWATMYNKYKGHFTAEEKKQYEESLRKITMDQMHSEVMKELLDPKPVKKEEPVKERQVLGGSYRDFDEYQKMQQDLIQKQHEMDRRKLMEELDMKKNRFPRSFF